MEQRNECNNLIAPLKEEETIRVSRSLAALEAPYRQKRLDVSCHDEKHDSPLHKKRKLTTEPLSKGYPCKPSGDLGDSNSYAPCSEKSKPSNDEGSSPPTSLQRRKAIAEMLDEASRVAVSVGDIDRSPERRRFRPQRRNSFVIHRKPGDGIFPGLDLLQAANGGPVPTPMSERQKFKDGGCCSTSMESGPLGLCQREGIAVLRRMSMPLSAHLVGSSSASAMPSPVSPNQKNTPAA